MPEKEPGRSSKPRSATTPEAYPTVPPSVPYPSGDYSYTIEVVMGMQKTIGQLEQAVKTLTEEFRDVRKKLGRISHIIYAAGVVGTIGLAVFIFVANKMADAFIASLKHQS
jgi:hypothetical protein